MAPSTNTPATPRLTLHVMTYNVQVGGNPPPYHWERRRPLMRELLTREHPDIIGIQEGRYDQVKDLAADLPAHDWIGLGRDGGSRGEFMAIFYRRDRFELLAFDHFWLSDTPEIIGSSTQSGRGQRDRHRRLCVFRPRAQRSFSGDRHGAVLNGFKPGQLLD